MVHRVGMGQVMWFIGLAGDRSCSPSRWHGTCHVVHRVGMGRVMGSIGLAWDGSCGP